MSHPLSPHRVKRSSGYAMDHREYFARCPQHTPSPLMPDVGVYARFSGRAVVGFADGDSASTRLPLASAEGECGGRVRRASAEAPASWEGGRGYVGECGGRVRRASAEGECGGALMGFIVEEFTTKIRYVLTSQRTHLS